jgi:hypothetical protein
MLAAIAHQESGIKYRRQFQNGPARSYLMFERGGLSGVLKHPKTGPLAAQVVNALDYGDASIDVLHGALEHNDIFAAAMGRLLLFTCPHLLPDESEQDEGWRQYQWCWRPGAPRPLDWPESWAIAWAALD